MNTGPWPLLPLDPAELSYPGYWRCCGAADMRRVDQAAIAAGMPAELLMENAARAVARAALRWLRLGARRQPASPGPSKVLVLCGPGNNGGDGWGAARTLYQHGLDLAVLALPATLPHSRLGADLRLQLDLCAALPKGPRWQTHWLAAGSPQGPWEENLRGWLAGFDLVIDALFGTGLRRELEPPVTTLLEALAQSGVPVLAVDLPSGVDADSGKLLGPTPQAIGTVTFGAWKFGLLSDPGRALAGRVEVAEIGLPLALIEALPPLPAGTAPR
jgi:ADP-dependent NAD(P)H-hydrate dehydratase / NAD(P)H-hydrate epimerase